MLVYRLAIIFISQVPESVLFLLYFATAYRLSDSYSKLAKM